MVGVGRTGDGTGKNEIRGSFAALKMTKVLGDPVLVEALEAGD